MADDDDDERGKKDNTGRDLKPKDVARYDHAPEGHLGQQRVTGPAPSLGMGGSAQRQRNTSDLESPDQAQEQKITFRRAQDQTPEKSESTIEDTRPYASKTGVEEIDQQSIDEGFQLKTEAELSELAESQQRSDEPQPVKSGDHFIETGNQDVDDLYSKTDELMSREEAERRKAEKIAQKFKADREKEQGRER